MVDGWAAGLTRELYLSAMRAGEVFFVATGRVNGRPLVLGFSSDYSIHGGTHGSSVYVRGSAARRGLGSALFRRAEAHAVACGATIIEIEASLAGIEFYRAHGFTATGRSDVRLLSGHRIECVSMRKLLTGL